MTETLSADQAFIRKLTDIVLANLENENFGVKELASKLNISHYRLSRKLYLIHGKKVNQFIREIRLKKSYELLQNEDATASEVSYNVGFSSPAYFNKCFREYFGYPPGKILRNESGVQDYRVTGGHIEEGWLGKRSLNISFSTFPGILIPIILLVLSGFLALRKMQSTVPILPDKRITIAVLPFQNRTNDTLWNVWEEGMQESLISWLSNSKELRVTRKETIYTLLKTQNISKYATVTPALAGELSNDLEANMFIYGSIIVAGPKIKLDAQLISTKTKEVLKSFEITAPLKDEIDFEMIDSLRKMLTDYLLISELITQNPWLKQFPRISTNSPDALKYYIYGNSAYYKADWSTARTWFLKALSVDSNYFHAMSMVYFTYKNQGMMEQGIPWLTKLYTKTDQMPDLDQLSINWSYAELFESPEVAIRYLRQLQEIDDQRNYYYLIGAMYVKAKQYEKSIPEYEQYLKILYKKDKYFLKNNWVFPALGEVYHLTRQYKKAKKIYKDAWKLNDDHSSVYFSWIIRDCGSLALSEGDTISANQYIKQFISVTREKSFSEADISKGLGDMYWLAEKWDKGIAYYRKALALEPENPERMNTLANRLIERNRDFAEVSRLLDKAMEQASCKYDYYNYSDTKGYCLYKQGKYQEALDILQKTWDETPFKLFTIKSHLEEVKNTVSGKL